MKNVLTVKYIQWTNVGIQMLEEYNKSNKKKFNFMKWEILGPNSQLENH